MNEQADTPASRASPCLPAPAPARVPSRPLRDLSSRRGRAASLHGPPRRVAFTPCHPGRARGPPRGDGPRCPFPPAAPGTARASSPEARSGRPCPRTRLGRRRRRPHREHGEPRQLLSARRLASASGQSPRSPVGWRAPIGSSAPRKAGNRREARGRLKPLRRHLGEGRKLPCARSRRVSRYTWQRAVVRLRGESRGERGRGRGRCRLGGAAAAAGPR